MILEGLNIFSSTKTNKFLNIRVHVSCGENFIEIIQAF